MRTLENEKAQSLVLVNILPFSGVSLLQQTEKDALSMKTLGLIFDYFNMQIHVSGKSYHCPPQELYFLSCQADVWWSCIRKQSCFHLN